MCSVWKVRSLLCNRLLLFRISVTVTLIGPELSCYRTALGDTQQSSRRSFGHSHHTGRQKACVQASADKKVQTNIKSVSINLIFSRANINKQNDSMCHHQVCFIQNALQHRLGLRDEETGERLNEKYNKQKWLGFFRKLSIWRRQTRVSGFSKILAAALRRRCARRRAAEESPLCDSDINWINFTICFSSSLSPAHRSSLSLLSSVRLMDKTPIKATRNSQENQTFSLWNSRVSLLNPSAHSRHIHHVVCLLSGGF